eukprot:COSAG01_NODE_9_length_43729_cov_66.133463_22_plen_298_part_00
MLASVKKARLVSMMNLANRLKLALEEDAYQQDITSQTLCNQPVIGEAQLIAKQAGIFYGTALITALCVLISPSIQIKLMISDASSFNVGACLVKLKGDMRDLLRLERVLLNLLQRLCGIASQTQAYVQALDDPNIKILDTRKTTPLWRDLEKAAVRAGGGYNHRLNLSDMLLIKENHLSMLAVHAGLGALDQKLSALKTQNPTLKIEIELETLAQLQLLNLRHVDYLLFDNFSLAKLDEAIAYCQQHYPDKILEVSGNINLANISRYRNKAIHRISCGALTHSVQACDLSLLFTPKS